LVVSEEESDGTEEREQKRFADCERQNTEMEAPRMDFSSENFVTFTALSVDTIISDFCAKRASAAIQKALKLHFSRTVA